MSLGLSPAAHLFSQAPGHSRPVSHINPCGRLGSSAARAVTAEGQPACPFWDGLWSRFSAPLHRLPGWAAWSMKSSSA